MIPKSGHRFRKRSCATKDVDLAPKLRSVKPNSDASSRVIGMSDIQGISMKDSLKPGVSRTNRINIDRDRTIGFMGEEGRVYATPTMVRDIEHTCRDLLMEHADPDED